MRRVAEPLHRTVVFARRVQSSAQLISSVTYFKSFLNVCASVAEYLLPQFAQLGMGIELFAATPKSQDAAGQRLFHSRPVV